MQFVLLEAKVVIEVAAVASPSAMDMQIRRLLIMKTKSAISIQNHHGRYGGLAELRLLQWCPMMICTSTLIIMPTAKWVPGAAAVASNDA